MIMHGLATWFTVTLEAAATLHEKVLAQELTFACTSEAAYGKDTAPYLVLSTQEGKPLGIDELARCIAAVSEPKERANLSRHEPQRRNRLLFSLPINIQISGGKTWHILGYNWNAQDYAKNSQNQFQWAQELIPKLKLQGNEALLDIGCGDGKITAELARCLPKGRAVGIDSSEKMIDLAKTAFPQKDYPNLSFQVMDARKLTFQ